MRYLYIKDVSSLLYVSNQFTPFQEMALSKKTDVRQMWEKIPFALEFKVYLFNYTNPEEVQKGGVPIIKEVGPYHFE